MFLCSSLYFFNNKDVYDMTNWYRSVHYKTYKECMSAYYRINIYIRSQSEVITSTPWLFGVPFHVGFEFEKHLKKNVIIATFSMYLLDANCSLPLIILDVLFTSIVDILCFWCCIFSSVWCKPCNTRGLQPDPRKYFGTRRARVGFRSMFNG